MRIYGRKPVVFATVVLVPVVLVPVVLATQVPKNPVSEALHSFLLNHPQLLFAS